MYKGLKKVRETAVLSCGGRVMQGEGMARKGPWGRARPGLFDAQKQREHRVHGRCSAEKDRGRAGHITSPWDELGGRCRVSQEKVTLTAG